VGGTSYAVIWQLMQQGWRRRSWFV